MNRPENARSFIISDTSYMRVEPVLQKRLQQKPRLVYVHAIWHRDLTQFLKGD